jgi:hypothetical protein
MLESEHGLYMEEEYLRKVKYLKSELMASNNEYEFELIFYRKNKAIIQQS